MPFRMIVAGITLLMVLAACSSAAPAASTQPAVTPAPGASATAPAPTTPAPIATVAAGGGALDACLLITKEEAAAATGVAVLRADGAGGACLYYGAGDALVVGLGTENDQYGLAALSTYLDDPANELVPGIGDKAVIYQAGGGQYAGRALYARKGTTGFHIDMLVAGMSDAEAKTALIALATIVASRI